MNISFHLQFLPVKKKRLTFELNYNSIVKKTQYKPMLATKKQIKKLSL